MPVFAQEKVIDLDALTFGQLRVRPQTVARTPIPAQGGAALLIGSPHPITISLLDPANQRITAANAAARGIVISSQPAEQSPLALLIRERHHGFVQFPPVLLAGNWRLELESPAAEEFTARHAMLHDSSLRFSLFAKEDAWPARRDVVLMAALYDGTSPVTNAQITAAVACRRDVNALMEVVRWRVITSELDGEERVFRVVLEARSNATGNLNELTVRLRSIDTAYRVEPTTLSIGNLAPGQLWTSPELNVRQPRGTFQPFYDLLFEARGWNETLTLVDSGDNVQDAESGDGLYGVRFEAPAAGECTVTGTAVYNGLTRSAGLQAAVEEVRGSIGAITDYAEDKDADGKPDRVGFDLIVNVHHAGTYALDATLAKGQKYTQLRKQFQLVAGQQSIRMDVAAEDLRDEVAPTGPFRREEVKLFEYVNNELKFVDSRDTAGSTAAWVLGGAPITVHPNGSATLAPFPAVKPAAGYDGLRLQVPVRVDQPGECYWQARVVNLPGTYEKTFREYIQATGAMPFAGLLVGEIPGWELRRAGAGGRFEIREVKVDCGNRFAQWEGNNLARTDPIPAADFANPAPSFELSLEPTVSKYLTLNRAASRQGEFFAVVNALAGFDNNLQCTATPQYPGLTVEFDRMPSRPEDWPVRLWVTATPAAAAGHAPVTVECTGRGLTRTVTFAFQLQ